MTALTPPHPPQHPVVVRLNAERAAEFELRLADRITAFAGSMRFVYLHALAFALWMLVVEKESVADADAGGVPRGDLPDRPS